MQLAELRAAGVPLTALTTPDLWYRPWSGSGKYHGSEGCHVTKARLRHVTIDITTIADDRFCWSCSNGPRRAEDRAYYDAAHTVLKGIEAMTKLEAATTERATLAQVAAVDALERSMTETLRAVADADLDAWAARHLDRVAALRDRVHALCPHADDDAVAERLIAVALATGAITADRSFSAYQRRGAPTVPTLPDDAFPALRGATNGPLAAAGQAGLIAAMWKALTGRFLRDGDLAAGHTDALVTGRALLDIQDGPQTLAQVPLTAAPPADADSVGDALTTVWRQAATAELAPLAATLRDQLTDAHATALTSPEVTVEVTGWQPEDEAKVRAAAPLLRRWPVVSTGGPALMRAPVAALSWLDEYGFVPVGQLSRHDRRIKASRALPGAERDTLDTLHLALRLLPQLPPAPSQRYNAPRETPLHRALTTARDVLAEAS